MKNSLEFGGKLSENKYLYNGKELQDEQLGGVNLDLYDYHLRFYDPALARFTTQDPLAEDFNSWTPYHYVHNNPINLVDPTGMAATKYEDEEGNTLLNTNDGSDAVVTVTDEKRQGFDAAVKGTKNTDDVDWNKSMKTYALGFSLSDKQEAHLSKLNSDWSRKGAINYWKTGKGGMAFGLKEVLSQWTNPELVVSGISAGVAGLSAVGNTARMGTSLVDDVAVHGNSLKSTRPTWGYKLYSKDGAFLKNGITSRTIPETRYTRAFMQDKYMGTKRMFPNRRSAYDWEYKQNLIQQGPLNKNMH